MNEQIEVNHTGGVGAFFFALIPGALAGAALMWLMFYTGCLDWQKTQRIEGRMNDRVGVHGELKSPVELIIRKTGCLQVDRAFLDNGKLTSYFSNTCHSDLDYWAVHWIEVAPDGTVVGSGYDNHANGGGVGIGADYKMELTQELIEDSRTAKVVVWVTDRP